MNASASSDVNVGIGVNVAVAVGRGTNVAVSVRDGKGVALGCMVADTVMVGVNGELVGPIGEADTRVSGTTVEVSVASLSTVALELLHPATNRNRKTVNIIFPCNIS